MTGTTLDAAKPKKKLQIFKRPLGFNGEFLRTRKTTLLTLTSWIGSH